MSVNRTLSEAKANGIEVEVRWTAGSVRAHLVGSALDSLFALGQGTSIGVVLDSTFEGANGMWRVVRGADELQSKLRDPSRLPITALDIAEGRLITFNYIEDGFRDSRGRLFMFSIAT